MRVFILPLILLASSVSAQQAVTSATLGGHAEDSSGAALSAVTVTIQSLDRGQTRTAQTNPQGRYQFLYLPAGRYELRVEAPNFEPYAQQLTLQVGQALD